MVAAFIEALVNLYRPGTRRGQSLVEYALIIVLIAIAVIAAAVVGVLAWRLRRPA